MSQEIIDKAITAHMAWTQTFAEAIASGANNDVILKRAGSDDLCAFGQWMYGLDDAAKTSSGYRRVKDCHYSFHVEAGVVARYLLEADRSAAHAALNGPFAEASRELVKALLAWKHSTA